MSEQGLAPLRGLRAAFVFLSRIPVAGFPYAPSAWRWAPAHFPFVGAVVGAASGFAFWLGSHLDPWLAAVLSLLVSIALTGAFHEDGLADTADALGGSHGNDRLFEILKDSRIGTFGAAALMLSLSWRAACLAALGERAPLALLAVHTAARSGPVWLLTTLPYLTAGPAKGTQVATAGLGQALVATGWPCALCVGLTASGRWSLATSLGVLATCSVVTVLARVYFKRRVGGIAGDFLGATEQWCECLGLAAVLAVARWLP